MKRGVWGVVAFLSMNSAFANAPECVALAEKQRLADNAKQEFVQACLERLTQNTGGENAVQKPSAKDSRLAACADIGHCDPSTQLEAAAAGLGNGTRANSGHSFVRLKRVSE